MLITNKATLVRTRVAEIRVAGRHSQGVRLIRLNEGESLVGLERIEEDLIVSPEQTDTLIHLAPEKTDSDNLN
jgi:DNA gyrase subunit A